LYCFLTVLRFLYVFFYVLDTRSFLDMWLENIFLYWVHCSPMILMVSFKDHISILLKSMSLFFTFSDIYIHTYIHTYMYVCKTSTLPGMLVHTCNPSTWGAGVRGSRGSSLVSTVRPWIQKKKKKEQMNKNIYPKLTISSYNVF
jgi:hypothetical protein